MNNRISHAPSIFFAGCLFGLAYTPRAFAACDPPVLLPNLRPLPAANIQLVPDTSGNVQLRFDATNWNSGNGRLELVATDQHVSADKQQVDQRIYDTSGCSEDVKAGDFVWHPAHNHFHFEGFADYILTPLDKLNPGRKGSKTTFCVEDTSSINQQLWGVTGQLYSTCGNVKQGMSVGWGDTYGSALAGQSIDVMGLHATGPSQKDYALEINVDPQTRINETNDDDNWSCVVLTLVGSPSPTSYNILQRYSGRCASDPQFTPSRSIASILPNQGRRGETLSVTITGVAFDPVMQVSFLNGSPLPTVSGVRYLYDPPYTSDSPGIQAMVNVPRSKKSKDPTSDLNVGSSASYTGRVGKANAFTIVTTP